jgi:alkaline phosphatase D
MPFTLGIASGYPRPDGMVLWTRLAPAPHEPGGGMPATVVPVVWEIASDEGMRQIVQQGIVYATPDWAHAVHVEPTGLDSGREYWFRFRAGGAESPVGRTRTAPALGAPVDRLRLAVASCQQYEHGYYAAYRHMVTDDPDLIVHVGDYIYELTWGLNLVRSHGAAECYTLEDYRTRFALYKSDPDLQAAHAACPWLLTWDDHEVDNDYAAELSEENDDPRLFLARRAAAYRAWYEHLPLPRRAVPFGAHARLYAASAFGDLAQIFTLDGRQYRSPLACPPPGFRGGRVAQPCPELADPGRSMLGVAQEEWVQARLERSRASWNLLAQQTLMTRLDENPGPGEAFWTDGWNGYPAARGRLLELMASRKVANPVVLSGDIHSFVVSGLRRQPEDPRSAFAASEFVTTSVSSQTAPPKKVEDHLAENPHILFGSGTHRGYTRLEISRAVLRADLVALDDVTRRDSGRRVLRSFVVESGRPGPQAA